MPVSTTNRQLLSKPSVDMRTISTFSLKRLIDLGPSRKTVLTKMSGKFPKNKGEGAHFYIYVADCMPKTSLEIHSYAGIFQGFCE